MLLNSIELENILSFKHAKLELRPLNVLIGANASGKSNLIRAFGLVKSLSGDLQSQISQGGGPLGWINRRRRNSIAKIILELPPARDVDGGSVPFVYSLAFRLTGETYEIVGERYSDEFERHADHSVTGLSDERKFFVPPMQTALSQIRHPSEPEISELARDLDGIRLYQEFQTGPMTTTRTGIMASALAEQLSPAGHNLALVLSRLQRQGLREQINKWLNRFFELFAEVVTDTPGGIAQLFVREHGIQDAFSAVSLSDGTLRLLCLLAVLLDPFPPKLVCIEEPEIGMHPDAIRMVAELLVEASSRMQLVVTTHSPALVDALGAEPESVIVCERDLGGFTELRRLKSEDLDEWLKDYSLGQLWQKGEIGGNRW